MLSHRMLRSALVCASLLALGTASRADSLFTFESTPINTAIPLTLTNSGLSASFSGSASVCGSSGLFSGLSGNVLIQNLCSTNASGPISIALSGNVSALSFNFGTAGGPSTLSANLFENGSLVGSRTFVSTLPTGFFNGEGLASLSGTFNSVTLSLPAGNSLALDNFDAVVAPTAIPEPSTVIECLTGSVAFLGLARRRFRRSA